MGCKCTSLPTSPEGREDIRDRYKIGKHIGSGAFGQVRDCWERETGDCFAVKIMEKRSYERGHWSNQNMFKREVEALRRFNHPNIIKYFDFYEDKHFFYAIMEKCFGGELFDQVVKRKHFTEKDCVHLCRQMLRSLMYIHNLGIVHRDIKAENFLFKDPDDYGELKLIDFGMCTKAPPPGQCLNEVCGSPHYLSPELIQRKYGTLADMWAFGVLVYLMLFGQYPYDSSATSGIIKAVMKKELRFPEFYVNYSSLVIDFIKKLLCKDPVLRLSAEQAYQHPWLQATVPETTNIAPNVRSAQRKVTQAKPVVVPSVEGRRDALLLQMEKLWATGHKPGFRVSGLEYPNQVKPEFKRRENRGKTTPSRFQQSITNEEREDEEVEGNDEDVSSRRSKDFERKEKSIVVRSEKRAYTIYMA